MKYRIKIQTNSDGSKIYYPQYKKFLFWKYYTSEIIDSQYIYTNKKFNVISFSDLTVAKNFIVKRKSDDNYTYTYLKM